MNLFKRVFTSVHAGVERTVTNMENHEAVVDAALRESREAVMRAKVRLSRLEKDGRKQQDRLTELTSEVELWTERARSCADTDRAKALSCLQRKKHRETDLLRVREQITEHEKIVTRVRGSIDESTNKVEALQSQRNHMRSREAAAQAGTLVNSLDSRLGDDVESAIERWEIKGGQNEILNESDSSNLHPFTPTDSLNEEFTSKEQNQLLEAELDELLKPVGDSHE